MAEVRIGALDDIPPGEGRNFAVDGVTVAVFHTAGGEVYATQAYCPHLHGPLADGLVGGTTLVCPLHDRAFDLRDGCGLSHEGSRIATYPARVDAGGAIWLETAGALEPAA